MTCQVAGRPTFVDFRSLELCARSWPPAERFGAFTYSIRFTTIQGDAQGSSNVFRLKCYRTLEPGRPATATPEIEQANLSSTLLRSSPRPTG